MPNDEITPCPLCGSAMSEEGSACGSCPLHNDCTFVCCPVCGYSTVAAERSRLARWAMRLFGLHSSSPPDSHPTNLADAQPNSLLQVIDLDGLAVEEQERLRAYGVLPGHTLHVIQQRPVTVVRVEQAEIAFERTLARGVRVAVFHS